MRAALGRSVLANLTNVAASIGASLVTLPFILSHIGTAGYGVWTIALTFILYLTGAEGGFGPAAQRWASLAHGGNALEGVRRVLWSSLLLYAAVGSVVALVMVAAAPAIVDIFDFPRRFHTDAITMFRIVGGVLALSLIGAGLGNVLQGVNRFAASAFSSAFGSACYLFAVFYLLSHSSHPLVMLAIAALAQQVATIVMRAWALRATFTSGRPLVLRRHEWRELLGFSGRLQVGVLSSLVNSQSDKVVVGLVDRTATVGQLGIASQIADAGRVVAGAALIPIHTTLALAVGAGDEEKLHEQFSWVHRIWQIAMLGGTTIGLAALYPLIRGWLGPGHAEAAVLGSFLVLGTGVALLSGTGISYLRAIGRPGLEGLYGVVVVALNLFYTVPLAIAFGARGVVCGTLLAYVSGLIWFMRRFWDMTPELPHRPVRELLGPLALALVAGIVTAAVGTASVEALPRGISLIPTVAVAVGSFGVYLAAATGTPLRLQSLVDLMRGLRPAPSAGGQGGGPAAGH